MSLVICKATGIVISVDEGEFNFVLEHPLAKYNQVSKTFSGRVTVGKDTKTKSLLAGSLITLLTHHGMLKTHNEDEALAANIAIVTQSPSSAQLLALVHRILSNKEVLNNKAVNAPKFCLAASLKQGNETAREQGKFLASLLDWINSIIPYSTVELGTMASSSKFNADLDMVVMQDGGLIAVDTILEANKRLIEDDCERAIRRMDANQVQKKARDIITLASTENYNLFTKEQQAKLKQMIKGTMFKQVVFDKVVAIYNAAINKEVESNQRRTKLISMVGWLKAIHKAWIVEAKQGGFDSPISIEQEKAATTEKTISLRDRLAALKRSK